MDSPIKLQGVPGPYFLVLQSGFVWKSARTEGAEAFFVWLRKPLAIAL